MLHEQGHEQGRSHYRISRQTMADDTGQGQSQIMGFTKSVRGIRTGCTGARRQVVSPPESRRGTGAVGSWDCCAGESKQASSVAVSRGQAGCTGGGEPGREGCQQASVRTRRISGDSKLGLPILSLDLWGPSISRPVPTAPNHYLVPHILTVLSQL